jgi:hypothetical protein
MRTEKYLRNLHKNIYPKSSSTIYGFRKEFYPDAKIGDIVDVRMSRGSVKGKVVGKDRFNHLLIEVSLRKNLVRVCMYCSKVFGEKEPFDDRSSTHGICEECMPGVLLNMLDEMNKVRRQRGQRELTMDELEEERDHVR